MPDRDLERLLVETAEHSRTRFYGKYRGLVRDVDDPETLGRIRAEVPEVLDDVWTPWALPSVPFAGAGHGLVVLPEPGDGVWVEFEAGDLARPIWSGCWWASGELPDPGAARTRVLATSAGHQLVLDDDAGEVRLVHAGGAELTMTNAEITLKIGSTQIVLSTTGVNVNNGAFEVR
jgi:uncharacterized protein involved in type VI secretion and phage assembly